MTSSLLLKTNDVIEQCNIAIKYANKSQNIILAGANAVKASVENMTLISNNNIKNITESNNLINASKKWDK